MSTTSNEKRLLEIDNEIKLLEDEKAKLKITIQEDKFNLSYDDVVGPYIETLLEKGYTKAKIKEGALVGVDRSSQKFPNIFDELVCLDKIFYVEDRGKYFDAVQDGFGFHCNVAGKTLYGNGSLYVNPEDIIKVVNLVHLRTSK